MIPRKIPPETFIRSAGKRFCWFNRCPIHCLFLMFFCRVWMSSNISTCHMVIPSTAQIVVEINNAENLIAKGRWHFCWNWNLSSFCLWWGKHDTFAFISVPHARLFRFSELNGTEIPCPNGKALGTSFLAFFFVCAPSLPMYIYKALQSHHFIASTNKSVVLRIVCLHLCSQPLRSFEFMKPCFVVNKGFVEILRAGSETKSQSRDNPRINIDILGESTWIWSLSLAFGCPQRNYFSLLSQAIWSLSRLLIAIAPVLSMVFRKKREMYEIFIVVLHFGHFFVPGFNIASKRV